MKRKILIIGASGFIGNSLFQHLNQVNSNDVFGTYFKNKLKNLIQLDYNNPQSIDYVLFKIQPDVIIWCGGKKNLAETEKSDLLTMQHNLYSIRNTIPYIKSFPSTHFIFLSTDYVFDGKNGNYHVNDNPKPNTIYGKSKWEAEKYIQEFIPIYSIVRTSAVIGKGSSFFDWICKSISQKKELNLYTNIFTPTPIKLLVESIQSLLEKTKSDIYHFCGFEKFSRYDIGILIAKVMNHETDFIKKDISNLFQQNLSMISSIRENDKLSLEAFIQSEIEKYENS